MGTKVTYKKADRIAGAILSAPAALWLSLWILIPVGFAFIVSFMNYDLLKGFDSFAGLENYVTVLSDERFYKALKNTLVFSVFVIPCQIILGLFLAYTANMGHKFQGFLRTVYYLPAITSAVAISSIFLFIFSLDGVANTLIETFSNIFGFTFEPVAWITDPDLALPLIIIMAVWSGLGFNMLIFLAAFQEIPTSVYEAAKIDGTSEWKTFFKITLPLISNQLTFTIILAIIGSLQIFELAFVASGSSAGAPNGETLTIIMYIYNLAFERNDVGTSSAAAFILFVIIVSLTVLQKLIAKRGGKNE